MQRIFLSYLLLLTMFLLAGCNSCNETNNNIDTKSKQNISTKTANSTVGRYADSIKLTLLVRNLYKWHEKGSLKNNGFKGQKNQPSDSLFTSIDLVENQRAVTELRQTGFFAESFLNDYRKIAVRMDKELRDGSSLWPDGELSTFGDDVDEWCSCQDFPVDKYWNIIKLADLKINSNNANFRWTWGDNFYYNVKAIKANGNWKISYLQGFDMNAYSWEWWKKNKKAS